MTSVPSSLTSLKCTFCTRGIEHTFYITCAVCTTPEVHLCVDCFSAGVNVGDHENCHPYRVPDCLDMPIFSKDWTIKEELLLLEGVQKHGAGNWKTISEKLLPNKTNKSMEEHYWELYMGRHGYCLPTHFQLNQQFFETAHYFPTELPVDPVTKEEIIAADDFYHIPVNGFYQRGEEVQRDIGKETGLKFKDRNEALQRIAQLPGADLPGYMPLREDFEVEYENDAEVMLADMEFSPDDHPSEVELKLQVIRIYNTKLAERDRRKRFVIDRGFIDVKGQQAKEKRLTKEERELVAKLRIFARFQTAEEYDLLVEGLLKARRLRHQVELYKLYKQMGFTTLQQVRDYEAEKKNQEKELKYRKQRESASYLFDKNAPVASNNSKDPYYYEDLTGEDNSYHQSNDDGSKKRKRGRPSSRSSANANSDREDVQGDRRVRGGGRATRSSADIVDGQGRGDGSTGNSTASLADDIERMRKAPYGDLLSELELELCVRVPLFPSYYLQAKRALIQEAYRTGMITQDGVKRILKLQPDQTTIIYDFFVKEMKAYEQQQQLQYQQQNQYQNQQK
mmetsp:Transcript_16109/g.17449  ORF Transcript_16109/g.17449 Transcript_16109/m.17449 type:complete len:565 (+) Transcript_16109:63-1757(+)|eukprot:gene13131-14414_t